MTEHTPLDESNDPEVLEEYAEEVGVDPTPQEVDQYVERIEGAHADTPAADTVAAGDAPYGRTPGDAPDVGAEHREFGYGDEQTGTANTVPDESVPRGRGDGGEPEGGATTDGPAGPARI